ncbi:phosphoribosylamine--glycine ligase [Marinobacter sp. EhC06]|uniref:phosphoribosylamine--glycine ligase n=1 Tax=Marinobacter shengliensis TaxID=1389223 RepID=A0ABV4WAH2_9GAMM|nr:MULTISPECIES: phosphoribosylamine--glycine ligase [unclassified Marinobacter]MAO12638.1 phosphoribosylamine--glycine ligase [Marinobacter sp.]OAN93505.1 phosphoribosylamine--glycine ligase [Marinobacter sp. EhC06]OAN94898.1 phosphoribosylamine--glycine ligase [Marinobacter sp. EhN04]
MSHTVMVIDSSGRGHALCQQILKTDRSASVLYVPGCRAIEQTGITSVPEIDMTDIEGISALARQYQPNLIIVSNIEAIRAGVTDQLLKEGWNTIGATAKAGKLETSKSFSKQFLNHAGVNTPRYIKCSSEQEAFAALENFPNGCVVKADGLCIDGDGVFMASSPDDAKAAIRKLISEQAFGDAGAQLLLEEWIVGRELSIMVFVDDQGGFNVLPPAMDYKRSDDQDKGINCAGMGSVFPHPLDSTALQEQIRTSVVSPIVSQMIRDEILFTGFFFIGAMLTNTGIHVLEINSRFGDSEAEVMFPAINANLTECFELGLAGRAEEIDWQFDSRFRVSVSLGQGAIPSDDTDNLGWPYGKFKAGNEIYGIRNLEETGSELFFANVDRDAKGKLITAGGRVAHVVGSAEALSTAVQTTYSGVREIGFKGMKIRTDIGLA